MFQKYKHFIYNFSPSPTKQSHAYFSYLFLLESSLLRSSCKRICSLLRSLSDWCKEWTCNTSIYTLKACILDGFFPSMITYSCFRSFKKKEGWPCISGPFPPVLKKIAIYTLNSMSSCPGLPILNGCILAKLQITLIFFSVIFSLRLTFLFIHLFLTFVRLSLL